MHNNILLVVFFTLLMLTLNAQEVFPVKVNQQWGLIDERGELVLEPTYQSIGEFKSFGYAIMEKNNSVGILNQDGLEVISPKYDEIRIVDSTFFAVLEESKWKIINDKEDIILSDDYQRVKRIGETFIAYQQNGKWGIVNRLGETISSPRYEEVIYDSKGYFRIYKEDLQGLLSFKGKEIISPAYHKIEIENDSVFFCSHLKKWGVIDKSGKAVVPVEYHSYQQISPNFYQLNTNQGKKVLFSINASLLIDKDEYKGFFPFSIDKVLVKANDFLGLLGSDGEEVLPPEYGEIQFFTEDIYRIKKAGRWGLISGSLEILLPTEYNYIAPPQKDINRASIAQNGKWGIIDTEGNFALEIDYDRIEWRGAVARAFNGDALELIDFAEEGNSNKFAKHFTITIGGQRQSAARLPVGNNDNLLVLNNFEWFYAARLGKWGLRRLDNGEIQIKPSFESIQVEPKHNMTIVAIEALSKIRFDRTFFRFEKLYGVVNNERGLLVTNLELLDIRLSDFDKGQVARCVFADGKHGLMRKEPVGLFVKKGYTYIGEFHNGLARMSVKGQLTGTTETIRENLEPLKAYLNSIDANHTMIDYTLHDQDFEQNAFLHCKDCSFGYIDTMGNIAVAPQFSYGENFVNQVGIVKSNKKWGMVNAQDSMLITCNYDNINFLANTDNKILTISNYQTKYGVIDTLGQVVVGLEYNKIGKFHEDRIAVKKGRKWGFVNQNGEEIIPCKYEKVKSFRGGMAAVKLGRKWGFIDKDGEVEIDFKYRKVGDFSDGLAWVSTVKGIGYIDKKGEMVIPVKYNQATDFYLNIARVKIDGKWGIINKEGKYFLKPKYSQISAFNSDGTAVARFGKSNFKYELINRTGNVVSKTYDRMGIFNEGLVSVRKKGKYGFINHQGKEVAAPQYSKVSIFNNSLAMVQREGNCGYINNQGTEVVPLKYSKCLDFRGGHAVVYQNGYRNGGIIDTLGQYLVEPSMDRLLDFNDGHGLIRDKKNRYHYIAEGGNMKSQSTYEKAGAFRHGVAIVKQNNKWGVINKKGIELIPPKYHSITNFENGYATIKMREFLGLKNLKGETIISPNYEYISHAGKGLFRLEQGNKIGYLNAKGEWIWSFKE